MIDLKLLRNNFELVRKKIKNKDPNFPINDLFEKDRILSEKKRTLEDKFSQINNISKKYSESKNLEELKKKSLEINDEVELLKKEIFSLEENFFEIYLSCPNLPDDSLPIGGKEKNETVRFFGAKKEFDFELKNHVDLLSENKILDLKVVLYFILQN
jgi:seryl-tRNA synthetase